MATKKTGASAKKAGAKAMTKGNLILAVVEAVGDGLTKKQVKSVLESLITVGHTELKKAGQFTLPGFAKFRGVGRWQPTPWPGRCQPGRPPGRSAGDGADVYPWRVFSRTQWRSPRRARPLPRDTPRRRAILFMVPFRRPRAARWVA